MVQKLSKVVQKCPKMSEIWSINGLKMVQKGSKNSSDMVQNGPKMVQEWFNNGSKMVQNGLIWAKNYPKMV